MYVCICNAVTDTKIKDLLKQGYKKPAIMNMTGCSQNCGTCEELLDEIIEENSDGHCCNNMRACSLHRICATHCKLKQL